MYKRQGLDHGILHQDTVLDHSTLLDLDAAEEHAVLHGAFDDAAVGQNGIHDLGTGDVTGGVIVADLGVDGAALGEQRFQIAVIDQLQVLVKVTLHVADMSHIAGVLQRMDVQDVDVVCQNVALEVDQAAGGSVLDQLDQGFTLQHIDVQIQLLHTGAVVVEQQLGHAAIIINGQGVVVVLAALGDLGLLIGHGHIGTAGLMLSLIHIYIQPDTAQHLGIHLGFKVDGLAGQAFQLGMQGRKLLLGKDVYKRQVTKGVNKNKWN